MYVKISWLFLFVTVGLLVWGVLCLVWSGASQKEGVALIVEDREQDLGEQKLGTHSVELRVRNTSSEPRRVIGMADQ